jgi:dienelactone hydrolase
VIVKKIMKTRAIFRAIEVLGKKSPFNVINLKVFYPSLEPQNDTEKNSGIISPNVAKSQFPVVIMLNGVNCPPESYQWLGEFLCEKGIVFVSFSWITDELFPDFQGLTPGIDMNFLKAENYRKGATGSAIQPILDDLAKLNNVGLLEGLLDLDNIILGGHSAGGSVALTNAEHFSQIKAVFSYGAHTQGSTMMGFPPNYVLPISSQKPILMMGGNNDGVITWSARRYGKTDEDSTISLKQTFEKAIDGNRGDRFLVFFEGANHFTFANPKDSTTGRPFLDSPPPKNEQNIRDLMAEMIAEFVETNNVSEKKDALITSFDRK